MLFRPIVYLAYLSIRGQCVLNMIYVIRVAQDGHVEIVNVIIILKRLSRRHGPTLRKKRSKVRISENNVTYCHD